MSNQIPRSWWWAAWIALGAVISTGVVGAIVLAIGAADPPKAGSREVIISAGTTEITLPAPPYTLELSGTLPTDGDPLAAWGITLAAKDSALRVLVNGYGFFSVAPNQPDFVPFIHLWRAGMSNTIRLDVDAAWDATLRLNDESAWHGKITPVQTALLNATPRLQLTHFIMYLAHGAKTP